MFVPSHAETAADIKELAQYNREKVQEVAETILSLILEPLPSETVMQRLLGHYGLTMNFEQYVLVGNTVRTYLSWLKDSGQVNAGFENNLLVW